MSGANLVTTPYGPAATEALHRAVAAAKAGDALAPVTVVVPSNYVGVAARRALAGGALGPLTPAGAGVAGVTFLTAYRLAELLGAPALALAGRRPVSTPVLAAAIRAVLTRAPGVFASVAAHPATEQALVASFRELSACTDAELDALTTAGPRTADVVRICRAARRALAAEWFDEQDLMTTAISAVDAGAPLVADLGTVVVHLPQDLSPPAVHLLRALARHVPLVVVAGVTGNSRADRAVLGLASALGCPAAAPVAVTEPCGTRVLSTSDPDDEVRAVVRLVVDALRDGVPLERMAVLYGAPEPYARLVHEHLTEAGIPHNGAAVRTLAGSVLGRGLLGLLSLPDRYFHRHDVMALLASVPVRHRGAAVPSSRWERITREAGIVRGASQWEARLTRHALLLEQELALERAVTEREPHPERLQRALDATTGLQAFTTDLFAALDAAAVEAAAGGWSGLVGWAQGLVRDFLGTEATRNAWPEEEVRAAEKVEAALERLAGLDAVEAAPTVDVFRRTLDLELDADLGRVGRLGEGLLMGHVALGLGLDLDRVFVCGLAEGTFPARVREDSLLPDADRRIVDGVLPLRSSRVDDDHRRFLAALAAARDERVLCYPRGDLRRTTERMPSRFLLDTVNSLAGAGNSLAGAGNSLAGAGNSLAGARLYADDLHGLRAHWFTPVPSFSAGLARMAFPATEQEHRLRALLAHERGGGYVGAHELRSVDPALSRGLDCVLSRASERFTRFDGNLAGVAVPLPGTADAAVSPTRLETWARCPFDYLMEHVLRVEVPELPEEVYELSPLEKGSLVHEVLDRFLAEVLTRPGGPPAPGEAWTAADRTRLREIGESCCDEYEARGVTGRRVFWQRDRARILDDLDRFLARDANLRDTEQATTLATELRFGLPGADHPAVAIPLSDGRVVHVRGAADRVDRTADGRFLVIDYKTGKAYKSFGTDPVVAGLRLQLPVYAHAARAAYDAPHAPALAAYWFVTTRGEFRWMALPLDDTVATRFDAVVRGVLDGIGAGAFPSVVDPPTSFSWPGRTYTDPDSRGTRDRWREWSRKCRAPEVRGWIELDPERAELLAASEASGGGAA
jgi:RecB family exonuclease